MWQGAGFASGFLRRTRPPFAWQRPESGLPLPQALTLMFQIEAPDSRALLHKWAGILLGIRARRAAISVEAALSVSETWAAASKTIFWLTLLVPESIQSENGLGAEGYVRRSEAASPE